jgi:hypothetical protein
LSFPAVSGDDKERFASTVIDDCLGLEVSKDQIVLKIDSSEEGARCITVTRVVEHDPPGAFEAFSLFIRNGHSSFLEESVSI